MNLARSCDDARNKADPGHGRGWTPGNSAEWNCSMSDAGMCDVDWGYVSSSICLHAHYQRPLIKICGAAFADYGDSLVY